ncbi:MAG: hypothetical protein ACR2I8_01725, partial [Steroidobacteraceae bacterium]
GRLMNNPQPGDAPWLVSAASNLIMASDAYLIPGLAELAIKPRYLELARQFYSFEIDFLTFYVSTPKSIAEYFNPEFLATGKFGATDFWRLMERNENYRWIMSTPLRNYYGEADEAVPPGIARMPAQIAGLLGTQTTAISAGPLADHRATYLFSLTEIPAWYRQFMH